MSVTAERPSRPARVAMPEAGSSARGDADAGWGVLRRRAALLAGGAALALAAVAGRLVFLQISRHDHFRGLRERQTRGVVVREQPRMRIAFRDGELAAQSLAADSIFVDPMLVDDPASSARRLAGALGRRLEEIRPLLDANESGDGEGSACRFRWIARRVDAETAGRVRALALRGVGFRTEYLRHYPSGPLAAQVLGGVGVDGQGLDGIELAGDALLRGTTESERVLRDARRRSIAVSAHLTRLRDDGGSLVLTIHRGLQWAVEEELDRVVAEHRPAWACAVVMDPFTGDVLRWPTAPRLTRTPSARPIPHPGATAA